MCHTMWVSFQENWGLHLDARRSHKPKLRGVVSGRDFWMRKMGEACPIPTMRARKLKTSAVKIPQRSGEDLLPNPAAMTIFGPATSGYRNEIPESLRKSRRESPGVLSYRWPPSDSHHHRAFRHLRTLQRSTRPEFRTAEFRSTGSCAYRTHECNCTSVAVSTANIAG